MTKVDIGRNQWRTTAVIVAPVVLLATFVAHPYLPGRLPNDAEVAEEEATVLRFQGTLHKDAPRPWDLAEVPVKAPLRW